MSRISEVIRNKKRIENLQRERRREEIKELTTNAEFKAKLYNDLKYLNVILDSDEIESVNVKVPDIYISKFSAAIYGEELAEYEVTQVAGTSNEFCIAKKYLIF